ncbi:UPF0488 protein C8orf33 homolog isoform X3 [Alligator mississippiensis]|uniref:UPF0488 protein C8orf33 homolog isoform X3 n=1 Tax=Alligator mississippiensis TaxID=8496 RepID=UPI0009070EF1|nr:UPF0488 protein C8orf33 homolog isoform X3 [Alligator mississippiensis]
MEEAPQGTFQDELEWCILQLEMGLLRLNPTPKQAEETQQILKVLRSHKAPFAKKRQVMNRVFGDYRFKMTEERKKAEKAAMKPGKVQIQQGNVKASGSMVYRKRSDQTSEVNTNWFTPSDNSFRFSFTPSETETQTTNETVEEARRTDGSEQRQIGTSSSEVKDLNETLNFPISGQGPEFAFNFVISDEDNFVLPSVSTGDTTESIAQDKTLCGSPSTGPALTLECSILPEANISQTMDSMDVKEGRDLPILETPRLETVSISETKAEKTAVDATSKKKKKKKKPSNSKKELEENEVSKKVKMGTSRHQDSSAPPQDQTPQSDEQLQREVDWCVEQLELGLKMQKSTPKQAAESAKVTEVSESTRRKSSQVFRKHTGSSKKSLHPAESHSDPLSHTQSPRASDMDSFVFTTSQEEFCFNFF